MDLFPVRHEAVGMLRPPRRRTDPPAFQSARLLDQLRERIRYLHYSLRTEQAYLFWSRAYIRFHSLRHPRDMGHLKSRPS